MQKEYTQTKEQVLEGLRTDRQGLSAQEAEKRLREHGENRLKEAEKLTLFQRFVQQLKDPMLLILLAAAAVSAVTNILSHESFTEVIIILRVVLLYGAGMVAVLWPRNTIRRIEDFRPTLWRGAALTVLTHWCVLSFTGVTTFIYSNF